MGTDAFVLVSVLLEHIFCFVMGNRFKIKLSRQEKIHICHL